MRAPAARGKPPAGNALSSNALRAAPRPASGPRSRRSARAAQAQSGLSAHAASRERRPAGNALSSSTPPGGRPRRSAGRTRSTRDQQPAARRPTTRRTTCRARATQQPVLGLQGAPRRVSRRRAEIIVVVRLCATSAPALLRPVATNSRGLPNVTIHNQGNKRTLGAQNRNCGGADIYAATGRRKPPRW